MNPTPEITRMAGRAAEIVRRHLGDRGRIVLFSSWADGTARERSDIDIGVLAAGPVDGAVIEAMRESIEELPTLYAIDLVDLATVSTEFRTRALERAQEIG
jgi:predicted nucleotidyltransferase